MAYIDLLFHQTKRSKNQTDRNYKGGLLLTEMVIARIECYEVASLWELSINNLWTKVLETEIYNYILYSKKNLKAIRLSLWWHFQYIYLKSCLSKSVFFKHILFWYFPLSVKLTNHEWQHKQGLVWIKFVRHPCIRHLQPLNRFGQFSTPLW